MKQSDKEKRRIYNVSFNKKKTTPINAELESIENAIIDYVIHYVKGEITLEELLNLGNSIREYLRVFDEVFDEPYLEDLNKKRRQYKESQMSDKELEQEILALENEVKRLEDSTKEIIQSIKERIQNLKDIAWDKQSKKESSSMYKVLKEDKTHTMVKSELGDIKVDKDFMQKEIQKHLDNPALRGMVTTQEMLSFPKVAKGVEAEYEEKHKNYTWKVKANDKSVIAYGSREYTKDNKETNRLLTAHSKTESNQRLAEMDRRGRPYHSIFNDFNFRKSANSAINSHDSTKTNTLTTQGSNATSIANESIAQINAHNDEKETISSKLDSAERMHENLQKDLAELNNQSKEQRNEARETEVDKDDILRRM